MKTLLSFCFLINCLSIVKGQVYPDADRQIVLKYNKIDSVFTFDRSTIKKNGKITYKEFNKTEISFLGTIETNNKRKFKILNSKFYFGLSPRASSCIVIYDDQDKYIGCYYVGMTTDLPIAIENNCLIFDNTQRKECDTIKKTKVSLYNGLPQKIFLSCKGKYGDLYYFN